MKLVSRATRSAFFVAAILGAVAAQAQPVDGEGLAMMRQAQKAVAAYHAGQPRSRAKLRVVYFVPRGLEPLAAHAERLDRVMTDVSSFTVNRQWKSFQSTVGLRDGAHAQGSAVFIVLGDGRELYRSRVHRVGTQESLNVSIASVKQLELRTEGTEGHTHNSWAIWVEPRVRR